jgi:predicted transglutaminase-like cysteine proteinase
LAQTASPLAAPLEAPAFIAEAVQQTLEDLINAAAPPRAEPDLFGFTTVRVGRTPFDAVWRESTSSPWPSHDVELDAFVARLRSMPVRSRAEAANAWINAHVVNSADPSVIDHWAGLAEALRHGHGECEDIAVAKLQLLAAAGVPRRNLYLVLARDMRRKMADDALVVVRDGDRVYVLDSRQDALVSADEAGLFLPVLSLGADGRWIFGKRRGHTFETRVASADGDGGETAVTPTDPPTGR